MRKKYLSYLLAAGIFVSAAYPCKISYADSVKAAAITPYENVKVISDFDITKFNETISENEQRFLKLKNYDEAKKFIQSEILILDDLSSSYNILQNKYFNDNTDMASYYQMSNLAQVLYEAEDSLSSCINKLAALDTYSKLKEDFKLPVTYTADFVNNQSFWINSYYECSNDIQKLSDIYINLVSCRNAEANAHNYAGYSEMLFKQVFNREYTLKDIQNIDSQLAALISLYSDRNISSYATYNEDSLLSAEETLNKFENSLFVLPESVLSIFTEARTNKLFSLSDNTDGSIISATSYLYKYHQPCTYIKYTKTKADFSNLINEFGLYTALYYKENNHSYFGSNNTSNDMLLTIRNYIKLLYSQNNYKDTMSEILEELKNSYVINSLETYAYTEKDLTGEKLGQKFYEINKSLGVIYPEGQNVDMNWVYIEDLYTSPFSMADNISSCLRGLQYYDVIKTSESGTAGKILNDFLTSSNGTTISGLLKNNNLSSCFDSGYIEQLSEKYKLYINDIYTVKNTDIAGDANNDGVITAADIVIIKRYILCAVNKSSMESRGYSLKNSDLNSDNKINILDLQKLYRLLLK